MKRHLQRQNSTLIVADYYYFYYLFFDTLFFTLPKILGGGGGAFTQMTNTRSSLLDFRFRSDYSNENRQCERYTGGTHIKTYTQ